MDSARDAMLPEELRITGHLLDLAAKHRNNRNVITLRVPPDTSHFRSLIDVNMHLEIDRDSLLLVDSPVVLMECWLNWAPYARIEYSRRIAITAWDVSSNVKAVDIADNTSNRQISNEDRVTAFVWDPRTDNSSSIDFSFKTSNAYFALTAEDPAPYRRFFWHKEWRTYHLIRHPFTHQFLNMEFLLSPFCAEDSFLHLETPNQIALRSRFANSDFYGLSIGIAEDGYRRNSSLFSRRNIKLYYRYGLNNPSVLAAPIIPVMRTGMALLIGGFALHAVANKDILPIASFAFGLSLAPWFFGVIGRSRMFAPSSAITRLSWTDITTPVFGGLQAMFVGLTAYAVAWNPARRSDLSRLGIFTGLGLVTISCVYLVLLWLGVLQRFKCDKRGKPIWRRRDIGNWWKISVDEDSRKVTCKNC